MTINSVDITSCRETVLKILTTEMTPKSHRAEFDDDTVYFSVGILEECDPEWILAQARDRRYPFEGRANLARNMVHFRNELWSELRQENPDLPPL